VLNIISITKQSTNFDFKIQSVNKIEAAGEVEIALSSILVFMSIQRVLLYALREIKFKNKKGFFREIGNLHSINTVKLKGN
jgi:hypothetical protein